MIHKLALKWSKSWLRKHLANTSFFETFKDFQNIASEGLAYGNDEIIAQAEANLLQQLGKNAPENAIVFDVGANVGRYSQAIHKAFKTVKIYAFEPSKATFEELIKNTSELPIENINKALSSKEGKAVLFIERSMNALNSLVKRKHTNHSWNGEETVQQTTLDNFCQQHQIGQIYLLKIDTEGFEMAVLLGAKEMLTQQSIQNIQFEFGGAMIDNRLFFKDFWELLSPHYQLYFMLKDGTVPIDSYQEKLENFQGNNFFAKLKTLL